MKRHLSLLSLLIAFTVAFSSLSLIGLAFGEEALSGEVIIDSSDNIGNMDEQELPKENEEPELPGEEQNPLPPEGDQEQQEDDEEGQEPGDDIQELPDEEEQLPNNQEEQPIDDQEEQLGDGAEEVPLTEEPILEDMELMLLKDGNKKPGKIKIKKEVKDSKNQGIEDSTEFKFEIWQKVNKKWILFGEPISIIGNGNAMIEVPEGEYKVLEVDIPNGYTMDKKSDHDDSEDVESGDTEEFKFINKKDTQKFGKLKIHKRIEYPGGNVNANLGDGKFTVTLTGPKEGDSTVRTAIIDKKGGTGDHASFGNLPYGTYSLDEPEIVDPDRTYSGWRVVISGNNNNTIVDHENIVIDDEVLGMKGELELWLINTIGEPEPWKGTIRIIKEMKVKNPNASKQGFEFELWKDNVMIGTAVTDEYGKAQFENLPEGTYKIKEVGDEYLAVYANGDSVTIGPNEGNENDNVWIVNVTNHDKVIWSKGKLIVTKIKLGLPRRIPHVGEIRIPEDPRGIEFTLEGDNLDESLTSTTDKYGIAIFDNLPEGTYTLKEIVPEGYESSLPEEGKEIQIRKDKHHGKVNVTVKNLKIIPEENLKVIIRKIVQEASENNEPQLYFSAAETVDLSGFKFEIWTMEEVPVKVAGPVTTNQDGEALFDDIPDGIYEIREVEARGLTPIGPFTVEVSKDLADGYIVYVDFINREILKEDIVVRKLVEGDTDLSGFTFRLYRVTDEGEVFIEVKTTDETGLVIFKNQPDGLYVIYEDVRVGYIMGIGAPGSEDGLEFYHSSSNKDPLQVINRKIPEPQPEGKILVEKIVQNRFGNVISGDSTRFFFSLYEKGEEDNWILKETKIISGNGTVSFDNLEDNEYIVREVNIDDDFELVTANNLEISVVDGNTEEVEFINRRIPPSDNPDDPDDDLDDDSDDPDDDSDGPDDTPETPETPTTPTPTTPQPEETVEVEVEIPEGTPEIPEDPEVLGENEEVIIAAQIPQGVPRLPRTGASSSVFVTGLGVMLLGLGVFLKKKE